MSWKNSGIIILAVGVMIFISNQNTTKEINKLDVRITHLEQDVLGVAPSKSRKAPTTASDIECMARNVFYEAGVESLIGKYAVAQVTLNRWSKTGSKSICNVVYAKTQVADERWVCQFSWACKGKLDQPIGLNWEQSKKVAKKVLLDGVRVIPLKEADHYHADYVKPVWADPKRIVFKEGSHIFYVGAKQAK